MNKLQFTADLLNEHLNRMVYFVIDGKLTNDIGSLEVALDGNDFKLKANGEVITFRNYAPIQLGDHLLRYYTKH